jgi:K+-transporting ATPase KdpF subunit
MDAPTIILAGVFSAGLFAYLFYALIKPERF